MTLTEAHQDVAKKVRSAQTSFYWPMHLQPRAQRQALFAIYTYCRTVDDIADEPSPIADKLGALQHWRTRVTEGFADPPSHTIDSSLLIALADVVNQFELSPEPFLAMIDGMETDVNGPVVAPSWSSLETYCAQVAGGVGDLCLAVWGWRGAEANTFAKATGEALQLTNILRDVKDDALNGRLYLPNEALASAGLLDRHPKDVLDDQRLSVALEPVFQRAQERFDEARKLWPARAPRALRPAWVMLSLYQALFNKVKEIGVGPNRPRARLSRIEKARHLTSAYLTVP